MTDRASTASPPTDVAVVGGGPAGLTCATTLRRMSSGRLQVTVLEREAEAGGVPRHCFHQGFGLRDLHSSLPGPAYARRLWQDALSVGVRVRTATQVLGWGDAANAQPVLKLTSPEGPEDLRARAVVLATGCRERPRAARLVPGDRPAGVMTTATLQQLVNIEQRSVGRRAVVVGAEHVAFSAVETLARAGVETVAMLTEHSRHQSFGAFRWGAALRYRVPLLVRTELVWIRGAGRVSSVVVRSHEADGTLTERELRCDTVVFTGDWVADHELAVSAGIPLDAGTRGPLVDDVLRTTSPGVFAVGNILHGAETADVASLSGAHAAAGVFDYLEGAARWPDQLVRLHCEPPLQWISPSAVSPGTAAAPPRGRYLLRARGELVDATVVVQQGLRVLSRQRLARLMPGRSVALRGDWVNAVAAGHGRVTVRLTQARRLG